MAGEPAAQLSNRNRLFDAVSHLKDAGAVTSSGAAQVGGSDQIFDMGNGTQKADLVLDVNAIDLANGDEVYRIQVQFSSSETFASDIIAEQEIVLGDATAKGGGQDVDTSTGRRVIPVTNVIDGEIRRYCRLYHSITGTTPSINYEAYMSQLQHA